MKAASLAGVSRRRFVTTTVRDGGRQAPDLVQRSFTVGAPNALWVADITYIPTWSGFLYLAIVLDAFSRRIIGWSMALTLHADIVLAALNMALAVRKPKTVIHHSDQGSQYTSIAFGNRCREAGVRPSMGSPFLVDEPAHDLRRLKIHRIGFHAFPRQFGCLQRTSATTFYSEALPL